MAPESLDAKYSETAWYSSGSPKDATTTCVVFACGDGGDGGIKSGGAAATSVDDAEEPKPATILICRSLWFVDAASFRCANLMPPLCSGVSLPAAAAAAVTENALRDEITVTKSDKKVNSMQDAQKRRLPGARRLFLL